MPAGERAERLEDVIDDTAKAADKIVQVMQKWSKDVNSDFASGAGVDDEGRQLFEDYLAIMKDTHALADRYHRLAAGAAQLSREYEREARSTSFARDLA